MVALALSQGRPGGPIAAVIGSALAMVGVGAATVPGMGAVGIGIATTAGAVVNVAMLSLHTEAEMRHAAGPVALSLAIGTAAAAAGYLAPLSDTWLGLIAALVIVTAVWSGLAFGLMRPLLRDAWRLVRPLLPPRLLPAAWQP